MTIYVGIDGGLAGAIVALDEDQNIIMKQVMPVIKEKGKSMYDIRGIVELFKEIKRKEYLSPNLQDDTLGIILNPENKGVYLTRPPQVLVCLEKAHVRPVQGKRAAYMTGGGYFMMQGILEALNISYETINPQAWMKEFEINSKNEKGSILFCQRKWPNKKWTATDRCSKAHDGLTDAACLALYCLRKNKKVSV